MPSVVPQSVEPQPGPLHNYVRRLRWRLWTVCALRALAVACGAGVFALLCAAAFVPPILIAATARTVWLCAGAMATLGFATTMLSARGYHGARITQLFEATDPGLGSRLRSALELRSAAVSFDSAELVQAHQSSVERALVEVPSARVVPWSWLRHWTVAVGLLVAAASAASLASDPQLRTFVHALFSPAKLRSDGTRIARVVEHFSVRLSYPSYLARPAATLRDPKIITAPRGTNIEVRVDTLLPAERGLLRIGAQQVALTPDNEGGLRGQLRAQSDASLRIQIESRGVRYEDPRAHQLHVVQDKIPSVVVEAPKSGALAAPDEAVTLHFLASDDTGLSAVELYARLPGGEETHRKLWSALDEGGTKTQLRASTGFVPAELGAREGDALVIWLQARDEDLENGPNVGKSAELTLEIASEQRRLSALLPDLQAITDAAVDLLGLRMADDVPRDNVPAKARFVRLEQGARAWLVQVVALLTQSERTAKERPFDADQIRGVRRRNARLIDEEARLYTSNASGYNERVHADTHCVDELERDVILLTDLLAKAHVDEAGAIADELRQLKSRIESLLDKLGKNHDPAAERELMAEIARAERRFAELAQSLSRMATRVPSEFVNRDALREPEADKALENLQEAVQKHDLRTAAKHLDELAKQIDELAAQIGKGGVRLRESRFGPRDQALAAARQQLDMLGQEQARLADRSRQAAGGGSGHGEGSAGTDPKRTQQLDSLAHSIDDTLGQVGKGSHFGPEEQALDRARERIRDTQQALRSGDMAAGSGTARAAQRNIEAVASALERESQMFDGRGKAAERAAQMARRAANDAARLAQGIEQTLPQAGNQSTSAERQKLKSDVDPQHKAREATEALKHSFENGPDGLPLSPDGAESLEAAGESMRKAEDALRAGQAKAAADAQTAASERLQKLSQKLAREQGGKSDEGGAGKHEGANGASSQAPVHIPGADDFKGPTQLRRKLLDAMREAAPKGFEAAVQRYYQELMR